MFSPCMSGRSCTACPQVPILDCQPCTDLPCMGMCLASALTHAAGCAELFQLQDSDADYPLLPGEAPSSTWPAVSHDVCKPTPFSQPIASEHPCQQ